MKGTLCKYTREPCSRMHPGGSVYQSTSALPRCVYRLRTTRYTDHGRDAGDDSCGVGMPVGPLLTFREPRSSSFFKSTFLRFTILSPTQKAANMPGNRKTTLWATSATRGHRSSRTHRLTAAFQVRRALYAVMQCCVMLVKRTMCHSSRFHSMWKELATFASKNPRHSSGESSMLEAGRRCHAEHRAAAARRRQANACLRGRARPHSTARWPRAGRTPRHLGRTAEPPPPARQPYAKMRAGLHAARKARAPAPSLRARTGRRWLQGNGATIAHSDADDGGAGWSIGGRAASGSLFHDLELELCCAILSWRAPAAPSATLVPSVPSSSSAAASSARAGLRREPAARGRRRCACGRARWQRVLDCASARREPPSPRAPARLHMRSAARVARGAPRGRPPGSAEQLPARRSRLP
eukprot:scaffold280_cov353-Prasinococcus_capsulatus_cf.AAC.7